MNDGEREELDTIPVVAIKRRRGDLEIATRGHGWPSEIPTVEGHDSWTDAMNAMKDVVNLTDAERGDQVGEMAADPDTREVHGWTVSEDYRAEDGEKDD